MKVRFGIVFFSTKYLGYNTTAKVRQTSLLLFCVKPQLSPACHRVRVVSCLLKAGRVDVIMSDADALWLGDPAQELFGGTFSVVPGGDGGGEDGGDCIRDSDVVASRGTYPYDLGEAWGSTICMGFILLRAKNTAAMKGFLDVMEGLVLETQDDQVDKSLANPNLCNQVASFRHSCSCRLRSACSLLQ